jgi:hypothetical protein
MHYRERLTVPAGWWATGMFFSLSFVTAVGFYAGPEVALAAGAVTAAAIAAALLWYGRVELVVDDGGLRAGDAVLEWPYVGEVKVLDRAATRARLGRDADHGAWLVVRGYVRAAVEVTVADAADPHPYWLLSSRHPVQLAEAIQRAISPSRT